MNLKSLKFRLVALISVATFIVGATIISVAIPKFNQEMIHSHLEQLDAVKESKKGHISDFFQSIKALLISNAQKKGTVDALNQFNITFGELANSVSIDPNTIKQELIENYNKEYLNKVEYSLPNVSQRRDTSAYLPQSISGLIAQKIYVLDNPNPVGEKNKLTFSKEYEEPYSVVHKLYHPGFNNMLEQFGLYDVFLVNLKGDVVYTVFKEKDFATNLLHGPYKNTGLATAYKKALNLNNGEIAYDDFKPYEPSYNAPAAFIASPLYDNGKKVGVLIFQFPIDKINKIMSFNGRYKEAGLGESGEAYLVGQDGTMKNNSRFVKDINDPLVKKLGTTIGVFKVNSDSTKAALRGKTGSWVIKDYRGVEVLSAYAPINVYGNRWAIIAEIDKKEALESATAIQWLIMGISVAVVAFFIILGIVLVRTLIVSKLAKLQKAAHDLALGEGDLTQRVNVPEGDEIYEVAHNINLFIEKVQETVSEAKTLSHENASVAEELSQTSMSIGQKAQEESQIVSNVSQKGEDLEAILQEAIIQAKETKDEIDNAESQLSLASQTIMQLAEDVTERSVAESELADKLTQLSSDAQEVKNVLDVIADIAEQTNLLALNAAIEAARAGEHGRGFAVVADEVRKLAERTQKSLTEINTTINVILQSISDTSESITTNAAAIGQLSNNANSAQDQINGSVSIMTGSIIKVDSMVDGYMNNTEAIQKMIEDIENINDLSSENARSVEEIAAASDHLSAMTAKLNDMLSQYRT